MLRARAGQASRRFSSGLGTNGVAPHLPRPPLRGAPATVAARANVPRVSITGFAQAKLITSTVRDQRPAALMLARIHDTEMFESMRAEIARPWQRTHVVTLKRHLLEVATEATALSTCAFPGVTNPRPGARPRSRQSGSRQPVDGSSGWLLAASAITEDRNLPEGTAGASVFMRLVSSPQAAILDKLPSGEPWARARLAPFGREISTSWSHPRRRCVWRLRGADCSSDSRRP